jgi:AmmeMemoRadiSam system protein B
VIATTDLTHTGPNFGTQQLTRQEINSTEDSFITSILDVNPVEAKRIWSKDKGLACGFWSLYILLRLAKKSGYIGTLEAYYDSQRIKHSDSTVSYLAASFDFPRPHLTMM